MSATKRLNPLDWTFLAGETREAMMHVGALMTFSPPPDAPPDLLRRLMDEVRGEAKAYPPWNLKLRTPQFPANPLQTWVEDKSFDVDYHIRRSALPSKLQKQQDADRAAEAQRRIDQLRIEPDKSE